MKECHSCRAMLEDDELFCHECGTKQEIKEAATQAEEIVASSEKKCIHCGETIEEDVAFCPFCGQSLTSVGEKAVVEKVVTVSKDTESNKNDVSNSLTALKEEKKKRLLTEKENKIVKALRIVGIVLGWCIIILPFIITGFSFGFFYYILIGVVSYLMIALHSSETKTDEDKAGITFCVIFFIIVTIVMYLWGPIGPYYNY